MTRRTLRLALFVVAIALAVWAGANPGHVVVDWQGYRIETSLALMVGGIIVLLAVYRGLSLLFRLPQKMKRSWHDHRHKRGLNALARGLTAAAADDFSELEKQAQRAHDLLEDSPLALLLRAQAAVLKGNDQTAQDYYADLAKNKDSRFLGLCGLAWIAERRGDQAVLHHALERANHARPNTPWVTQRLIELTAREGNWSALIGHLTQANKKKNLPAATIRSYLATAWTAQAQALHKDGDKDGALTASRQACRIDPAFPPAVALAILLLGETGSKRRATRLAKKAWETQPHRVIAQAYRRLIDAETPRTRMRRIDALVACHAPEYEGHLAQAQAALEAELWDKARDHLTHIGHPDQADMNTPTHAFCLIMAALERAEHNDTVGADQWLSRSKSAPPDPGWTCRSCHTSSDTWVPCCPACGSFATLVWQTPRQAESLPTRVRPPLGTNVLTLSAENIS